MSRPASTPREYPAGFFTEPVRAWAGMQFKPQIAVDPKTKRFETDFARQQRIREGSGWNVHKLDLPGTLK